MVTLLLLLDAMTFDGKMIQEHLIEFIACLGLFCEFELIRAHDLGRLERDMSLVQKGAVESKDGGLGSGLVNSFLLFLKTRGLKNGPESMQLFIKETDRTDLRDKIRASTDAWQGMLKDAIFESISKASKEHWNVSG
jgi:hypothetical protein